MNLVHSITCLDKPLDVPKSRTHERHGTPKWLSKASCPKRPSTTFSYLQSCSRPLSMYENSMICTNSRNTMLIMWRVFTPCTRCHRVLLSLSALLILCPLLFVYSLITLCPLCLGYLVITIQDHLWRLLGRHTTMGLVLLYLVYSQVSTVVRI